jgi:3-hydroxyisobutyrate dehydrogenase-like beta-hydroxyacid dehydrogenase
MGLGMVKSLVRAGHTVTVWNRSPERASALEGVAVAPSVREAVEGASFVLYCLADDQAVREVAFGPGGTLECVTPAATVVDMSTISAALSSQEAAAYKAKGIAFLDAPVFGSKGEAESGGLWTVAGGEPEAFGRTRPVLEALSETVHYMGGPGSGIRMKLVGNLIVAGEIEVFGEALTLAKSVGLDLREVVDAISATSLGCPFFSWVASQAMGGLYKPAFALKLAAKDVRLIEELAAPAGAPVPVAAVALKHLDAGLDKGWGDRDATALAKVIAVQGGVDLAD